MLYHEVSDGAGPHGGFRRVPAGPAAGALRRQGRPQRSLPLRLRQEVQEVLRRERVEQSSVFSRQENQAWSPVAVATRALRLNPLIS